MVKCGQMLAMTAFGKREHQSICCGRFIFCLTLSPSLNIPLLSAFLSLPLPAACLVFLPSLFLTLCFSVPSVSLSQTLCPSIFPPSFSSHSPAPSPLSFSCLFHCLCLSKWLPKCEGGLLPKTSLFFPVLLGGLIKDTFFSLHTLPG